MASFSNVPPAAPRLHSYTLPYFYCSTSFTDDANEIDKSQGSAVLLNGHVIYSPNCSHPDVPLPSDSLNPGLDISSLERPLWWSIPHENLPPPTNQADMIARGLDPFLHLYSDIR